MQLKTEDGTIHSLAAPDTAPVFRVFNSDFIRNNLSFDDGSAEYACFAKKECCISFAKKSTIIAIIMFILGNFLVALAKLIYIVSSAYIWIVIARAVISWVNADPYNPIVRFLVQITDPVLYKIRRYLPPMGGLDLSPMILILVIVFLQSFLVPTFQHLGQMLSPDMMRY